MAKDESNDNPHRPRYPVLHPDRYRLHAQPSFYGGDLRREPLRRLDGHLVARRACLEPCVIAPCMSAIIIAAVM